MSVTGGFIDQCEREPLHLSGAIQSHGAMVVCRPELTITHVSGNCESWFGQSPGQLIGEPLPAALAHAVRGLGCEPGSRVTRWRSPTDEGNSSLVATRAADASVVIELIPADGSHERERPVNVHRFDRFMDDAALSRAQQTLVDHIREETGFDRVMYYQFRQDGAGEVIAEATGPGANGSYLGLRFPASDIPQIARNLYCRTPWRSIAEAQAEPVNLISRDAQPPDLTYCDLRSVAEVHRSYMTNMKLASSVSFPIASGDDLKALISCHSHRPHRLSLAELESLTDQVEDFTLNARELAVRNRITLLDSLESDLGQWTQEIADVGSFQAAWPKLGQRLMAGFGAQGVLVDTGDDLLTAGLVPDRETLTALITWCDQAGSAGGLVESDHLISDCPDLPLTEIAGLLAVSFTTRHHTTGRCLFFRAEELHEVVWGGQPHKPEEQLTGPYPIAPRRSFERWVERRLGYAREWPDNSRIKLYRLREFLTDVTV